jgi:hypothetical protein
MLRGTIYKTPNKISQEISHVDVELLKFQIVCVPTSVCPKLPSIPAEIMWRMVMEADGQ